VRIVFSHYEIENSKWQHNLGDDDHNGLEADANNTTRGDRSVRFHQNTTIYEAAMANVSDHELTTWAAKTFINTSLRHREVVLAAT
jgi:hypothetical protein